MNDKNKTNHMIAITGKGGVGKTTISALMVRQLIARGRGPVLAVDADANMCLDRALGVAATETVGRVREQARAAVSQGLAQGVAKQQLLEMKIAESLVEAQDFDLIAMGRPEGAGCYCYANNVLKSVLAEIAGHYPVVVLDNEAGLENLSRRLAQRVDLLAMVCDPSHQGYETVKRIYNLAGEMNIRYNRLAVIVNRLRGNRSFHYMEEIKAYTKADYLLLLPDDEELAAIAEKGASVFNLSLENPVVQQIDSFLELLELEKASTERLET